MAGYADLEGKVAVVTGHRGGLGSAIVEGLGRIGATSYFEMGLTALLSMRL